MSAEANQIGDAGAESLAGVLGQCRALAHLDLGAMPSTMSEKAGFELRGVVRPLALFVGTLSCLLVDICLADRQQERATYCTHTVW